MTVPALLALLGGIGAGLALIVAIGAQNAYVLRQGLLRQHVGIVVAVCVASDAVLILAGVAGLGALVDRVPVVVTLVTWAGAAFLATYGVLAARRALAPRALDRAAGTSSGSARRALVVAVALTWLNPHVYLDTVLLLGSLANAQGAGLRWWFAAGAILASTAWFAALGYGARLLGPVVARPAAWRVLDAAVAVAMLGLAAALVVRAWV